MKNIDLSNFRVQIENFVNHLADPALLTVPNDPVFVSYRKFEQLRLMSASSLKEMSKQMEESRQFIEKAPKDISEIAMVVSSSTTDKPYEKALKDILQYLVEKGMNRAEIRMTCNVLNLGLIQAMNVVRSDAKLAMGILNDIKTMVGADKEHLVDDYLKILNSPDKSSGFKLLPQYLEELRTQQMVELETQRKKLRDENGDDLKEEEVICPLTRQVINVERSLVTQADATQFMMLIIALAQLAKIKNNELDEFISSQDNNYVDKCCELLQQYVQSPKQFAFTEEQQGLLHQLGISTVLQQWQIQGIYVHSGSGTEDKEKAHETSQYLQGQSFRFFSSQQEKDAGMQQSIYYTSSGEMQINGSTPNKAAF